jgi:hypothetical protein
MSDDMIFSKPISIKELKDFLCKIQVICRKAHVMGLIAQKYILAQIFVHMFKKPIV